MKGALLNADKRSTLIYGNRVIQHWILSWASSCPWQMSKMAVKECREAALTSMGSSSIGCPVPFSVTFRVNYANNSHNSMWKRTFPGNFIFVTWRHIWTGAAWHLRTLTDLSEKTCVTDRLNSCIFFFFSFQTNIVVNKEWFWFTHLIIPLSVLFCFLFSFKHKIEKKEERKWRK